MPAQTQTKVQPQPEQPPEKQDTIPSKKFNFSLFFLVLVVIGLIIMVGYLMYQNFSFMRELSELKPVATPGDEAPAGFSRVNKCSKQECLFARDFNLEGYATLKGYYKEYESEDWDKSYVTCKGLVVTGGNETLIKHFRDIIEKGNKLNKIIEDKLVINLPMDEVKDSVMEKKIVTSNEKTQIELGVIRLTPIGKGDSTCSSIIDIVTATAIQPTPEPKTAKVTGSVEIEKVSGKIITLKLKAESEAGKVKEMLIWTDKKGNEKWEQYKETYEVNSNDLDHKIYVKYRNEFGTMSEEYFAELVKEREVPVLP